MRKIIISTCIILIIIIAAVACTNKSNINSAAAEESTKVNINAIKPNEKGHGFLNGAVPNISVEFDNDYYTLKDISEIYETCKVTQRIWSYTYTDSYTHPGILKDFLGKKTYILDDSNKSKRINSPEHVALSENDTKNLKIGNSTELKIPNKHKGAYLVRFAGILDNDSVYEYSTVIEMK